MKNSRIIIDQEKCIGCGLCANTCHQGVIELIDGKATVVNDELCDNLGRCLPVCPAEAITMSDGTKPGATETKQPEPLACGCPGTQAKALTPAAADATSCASGASAPAKTELRQWPVQIQLVPENAPYFDGAHLLVAADCTAYAYGNFHAEFMRDKITLVGCPKLDPVDYSEKLTKILANNNIKSVTLTRMEVPCCGGLERAVITALQNCGKMIPWQVVTIGTDGRILPR